MSFMGIELLKQLQCVCKRKRKRETESSTLGLVQTCLFGSVPALRTQHKDSQSHTLFASYHIHRRKKLQAYFRLNHTPYVGLNVLVCTLTLQHTHTHIHSVIHTQSDIYTCPNLFSDSIVVSLSPRAISYIHVPVDVQCISDVRLFLGTNEKKCSKVRVKVF